MRRGARRWKAAYEVVPELERSEVGEGLPELEDVVVCERIGEAERKRSHFVHVGGE